MIKQKIGKCSACDSSAPEQPLIKGKCQRHYWQDRSTQWKKSDPKEKKPIPKVSKKQLENLKEYRKIRDEFMKNNKVCKARLQGCTVKATDLHHKKSRVGELLTDAKYFMAVCRNCHNKIENGGEWVYELGFKEKRI